MIKKGCLPQGDCLFERWYWTGRVARTSTAPSLRRGLHALVDEVLQRMVLSRGAAPPDVEGSTLQAHFVLLLDGACPPRWKRVDS